MSGEAAQQVLDSSVDAVGLSVVSTTRSTATPRNGAMYNPVALAAGVPIWFHALQDSRYVALFRSHWIDATVGAGGPQSYTAHTDAGSCWVRVAPPQGDTVALGRIPSTYGVPVVNGAASRGDFLFTVGNVDGAASIQHHRISAEGLLLLAGEELMFPVLDVTFDRGCFIQGEHLVVVGADSYGNLCMARRRWGRIGSPDLTMRYTWEYRSAKGWLADVNTLEPIGLTSVGPVSVAKFKDRLLVSTVVLEPGEYVAKVYVARATDPFGKWKLNPGSVSLGAGPVVEQVNTLPEVAFSGSGTLGEGKEIGYLGGTLYFQPLNVNPVFELANGVVAQLPYVSSTLVTADGEESINTAWGLWPIGSNV